jgi:transposase InsO family protein
MSFTNIPTFPKLTSNNYPTWADNMEAYLMSIGVWRIVSGQSTHPALSITATMLEIDAVDAWLTKSDKAAGSLYLMVEHDQTAHFSGIKHNPIKMWSALKAAHMGQCSGSKPCDKDMEFAGNASALSTYNPSDPSTSPDTDFDWIADTGATSHMTPHRHWVRNYTPLRIPIKLANHSIIYSAGIGTVVFNPVVKGKRIRSVEFSRVLHVPQLRNNLLSVLYLAKHKHYKIAIDHICLAFRIAGKLIFNASILDSNCALLDGHTEPVAESANVASTLPLNHHLWHRRCAHHNYADIDRMVRDKLVTGLVLTSSQTPDPICEPCLAGKMHSNPFPASHRHSTKPLELIHSDLHGPLPVQSHDGYRYWITFIDDHTHFRAVMKLKRKSDAFDAFKIFKAFAENALNAKIKALQDDKAGEYMSTAFIKFTDECGIHRRHTTRNRPQQNGVAERANRTMSDDMTAMLSEAHLPASMSVLYCPPQVPSGSNRFRSVPSRFRVNYIFPSGFRADSEWIPSGFQPNLDALENIKFRVDSKWILSEICAVLSNIKALSRHVLLEFLTFFWQLLS